MAADKKCEKVGTCMYHLCACIICLQVCVGRRKMPAMLHAAAMLDGIEHMLSAASGLPTYTMTSAGTLLAARATLTSSNSAPCLPY
jgi:hypothetical protein